MDQVPDLLAGRGKVPLAGTRAGTSCSTGKSRSSAEAAHTEMRVRVLSRRSFAGLAPKAMPRVGADDRKSQQAPGATFKGRPDPSRREPGFLLQPATCSRCT